MTTTSTHPADHVLMVELLATKRGPVAHVPGCRHAGKAESLGTEPRELHTLLYADTDVADCLHTQAWGVTNALQGTPAFPVLVDAGREHLRARLGE